MNHSFLRQGFIALLASAVTATSTVERPSQCTDGESYFEEILYVADSATPNCGDFLPKFCRPTVCPGIDVVLGKTRPFQYQDDFPGIGNFPSDVAPQITSTYEFWVDGKKEETLQCFKSKGLNVNEDVSEDGVTTSIRGHVVLNLYDDPRIQYIFSGLNPNNITAPGVYYMQVSRCGSLFFSASSYITYITYAHMLYCREESSLRLGQLTVRHAL